MRRRPPATLLRLSCSGARALWRSRGSGGTVFPSDAPAGQARARLSPARDPESFALAAAVCKSHGLKVTPPRGKNERGRQGHHRASRCARQDGLRTYLCDGPWRHLVHDGRRRSAAALLRDETWNVAILYLSMEHQRGFMDSVPLTDGGGTLRALQVNGAQNDRSLPTSSCRAFSCSRTRRSGATDSPLSPSTAPGGALLCAPGEYRVALLTSAIG